MLIWSVSTSGSKEVAMLTHAVLQSERVPPCQFGRRIHRPTEPSRLSVGK
jgi:hypothetical protein